MNVSIGGTAVAIPGRDLPGMVVTNELLSQCVREYSLTADCPVEIPCPDFAKSRAGIEQRCFLDERFSTGDLALCAARQALVNSRIPSESLRAVIVTSVTSEQVVPSVAGYLQAELGMTTDSCCIDSPLGCNGYLGGLFLARSILEQYPPGSAALLVNAEAMSRVVNALDRQTSVIFGDGAAATVLVKTSEQQLGPVSWHTQGSKGPLIQIKPTSQPVHRFLVSDGKLRVQLDSKSTLAVAMDGRQVFRDMVTLLPALITSELRRLGLNLEDFDWVALHQANLRIVEAVVNRLGVPAERVLSNIAALGNTSSASLPILLHESQREGKLRAGHRVLLVGFGTGYSVGLAPITWGKTASPRHLAESSS